MHPLNSLEDNPSKLRLLNDGLDLGDQVDINKRGNIEAADAADDAQVKADQVETGQVEVAEDSRAAELRDDVYLLQLQQGVEVEDVADEEVLEADDVEVVEGGELREGLQVEAVDGVEVLQVLVCEAELVECG